jgi:hypothetical protein
VRDVTGPSHTIDVAGPVVAPDHDGELLLGIALHGADAEGNPVTATRRAGARIVTAA